MNFEVIERVVVILFAVLFLFPHLCFCKYLFECVLYNIIGYNFDKSSMNFKYIECVVVILFTLLFCFTHLCRCDDLSSEYVR